MTDTILKSEFATRLTTSLAVFVAAFAVLMSDASKDCALGQEQSGNQVTSVPEPTVTVANAGASRHVAGRWSTLSVNGLNKTSEDAEEMSVDGRHYIQIAVRASFVGACWFKTPVMVGNSNTGIR